MRRQLHSTPSLPSSLVSLQPSVQEKTNYGTVPGVLPESAVARFGYLQSSPQSVTFSARLRGYFTQNYFLALFQISCSVAGQERSILYQLVLSTRRVVPVLSE